MKINLCVTYCYLFLWKLGRYSKKLLLQKIDKIQTMMIMMKNMLSKQPHIAYLNNYWKVMKGCYLMPIWLILQEYYQDMRRSYSPKPFQNFLLSAAADNFSSVMQLFWWFCFVLSWKLFYTTVFSEEFINDTWCFSIVIFMGTVFRSL